MPSRRLGRFDRRQAPGRARRPFYRRHETGSHTINPSASIGISLYPQDGDLPERLLQDADCALYRAKWDGKDCYRFFHPGMRTSMRAA